MSPIKTESRSFAEFRAMRRPEDVAAFGERLAAEGFTPVRRFLDDFRVYLQSYDEPEADEADALIARGRLALPEPMRISPSWDGIWREYERIAVYKRAVFAGIPASQRQGEWQVLLDNPYSTGSIAVYPSLSFLEAAYMYAYFRTGLEKNEIIRMQKIETVIAHSGADE